MVGAKNIACTFAGVRSVYFTIIPPLARFGRYIRPNRLMGQEYALLLFRDFQSPSLAWALPFPVVRAHSMRLRWVIYCESQLDSYGVFFFDNFYRKSFISSVKCQVLIGLQKVKRSSLSYQNISWSEHQCYKKFNPKIGKKLYWVFVQIPNAIGIF